MDRDFMREGEPLFDWEKVVIEKRRKLIVERPRFDESSNDAPAALPKGAAEGRRMLGMFQGLFGKRQSS